MSAAEHTCAMIAGLSRYANDEDEALLLSRDFHF